MHYSFTFAFHKGCLKGKANSTISKTSYYFGCISFVSLGHPEQVLSNEVHMNCAREQSEQCSTRTTFLGSADRIQNGDRK
jgi:hypothetical protein